MAHAVPPARTAPPEVRKALLLGSVDGRQLEFLGRGGQEDFGINAM